MRAVNILSVAALVHSVCGYVFPGQIAATPAGVFRRESGSLVKRQELCDPASGLSCRVGEYCVMINGSVGCCPDGKVCGSIRTCVDHDTYGCKKGGTVNGSLCCDASVPYCNTLGNTQFCDVVKQEITITTVPTPTEVHMRPTANSHHSDHPHPNITTTECESSTTPTTHSSHLAGNTTTTYALPTLTPYPSDTKPNATFTMTTLPTTLLVAETTSTYILPTTNVTSTVPTPSAPAQEGSAVSPNVSSKVLLGVTVIAFLGAFLG